MQEVATVALFVIYGLRLVAGGAKIMHSGCRQESGSEVIGRK